MQVVLDASLDIPEENKDMFALATVDGEVVDRRTVTRLSGVNNKAPSRASSMKEQDVDTISSVSGEVKKNYETEFEKANADREEVVDEFAASDDDEDDDEKGPSSACCLCSCLCWTLRCQNDKNKKKEARKKKVAPIR